MDSISTYSDARTEYLKQLSTWIAPHMIQHYRNLWSECVKQGGESKAMLNFQERCTEVPKWNQDTIDENVNKLLDSCRCDYLEELMAAVFIAHTKVLIAIRVSSKHKKLQITLPKLDHFLHRVYSECARGFWKAPFLFLNNQQPIEMQKNLLQAESLCNDAISSAVRSLLPIKNILNEYLSDEVNSTEPLVEDVTPNVSDDDDKVKKPKRSSKNKEKELEKAEQLEKAIEEVAVEPTAEEELKPIKGGAEESLLSDTSLTMLEPVLPAAAPAEQASSTVFPELSSADKITVTKLESGPITSPEEITVDTKPTVHFNNYDNVFDETNEQTAPFKYAPKDIEPGEMQILEIKEDIGTPLSLDASVMSLETPGAESKKPEMDILVDSILE